MAVPASVARRWVVGVLAVLVAMTGIALARLGSGAMPGPSAVGPGASDRGPAGGVVAPGQVGAIVERTIAAGSARLDGSYAPASGPEVELTGRVSFRGPESEMAAGVDGELPSHVRVTASGAAVRLPGSGVWTPVPITGAGALGSRGWAEVLRDLDRTSAVWADADGRVARVRMATDRRGGTIDLRFSDFGIEVATGPP